MLFNRKREGEFVKSSGTEIEYALQFHLGVSHDLAEFQEILTDLIWRSIRRSTQPKTSQNFDGRPLPQNGTFSFLKWKSQAFTQPQNVESDNKKVQGLETHVLRAAAMRKYH